MGMSDYKFSDNFESGLVSELEIRMIYPKVAIFMDKYAHSNPGILMQETMEFLGPKAGYHLHRDVGVRMLSCKWYGYGIMGKNIGKSWEYAGI